MKRTLVVTMLLAGSLLWLAQFAPTSEAQAPACSPGPGEIVNDFVYVDTVSSDGFVGPAMSTVLRPTGETLVVHIDPATNWLGVVQSLADVTPDLLLQVVGRGQDDCSVVAITVLSTAETPAATPAAPAQPVASIALPAPGAAKQLYPGCNNVSLTFPGGTASETVVQAVTPAGLVDTLWRHDAALNRFEGFSPTAPQASDLLTVNFLDAAWLCLAAGAPLATPTPTGVPQTLSEADAGATAVVRMHDTIEVVLEGNPTTGFTWERAPDDESAAILEQLGDPEFQPDTELVGSGGKFTFRFEAVASGQAVLRLIYHRPWETDVPPEKTFEVTISVPSPSV